MPSKLLCLTFAAPATESSCPQVSLTTPIEILNTSQKFFFLFDSFFSSFARSLALHTGWLFSPPQQRHELRNGKIYSVYIFFVCFALALMLALHWYPIGASERERQRWERKNEWNYNKKKRGKKRNIIEWRKNFTVRRVLCWYQDMMMTAVSWKFIWVETGVFFSVGWVDFSEFYCGGPRWALPSTSPECACAARTKCE